MKRKVSHVFLTFVLSVLLIPACSCGFQPQQDTNQSMETETISIADQPSPSESTDREIATYDRGLHAPVREENSEKPETDGLPDLYVARYDGFFDVCDESGDHFDNSDGGTIETPEGHYFGDRDFFRGGCSQWCIAQLIESAEASSELEEYKSTNYRAENLLGQCRDTTWCEGVKGYGIGEYFIIRRTMGTDLYDLDSNPVQSIKNFNYTNILFVNGYAKNEKLWRENSRVKTLKMYVDNCPYARLHLEDSLNPQVFDLGALNVDTAKEVIFKFVIEDVYLGDRYEDTCLTGVDFKFDNFWH